MASGEVPLTALLKRDRLIVAACLALIAGLAWAYLLDMAAGLGGGGIAGLATQLTGPRHWDPAYFLAMVAMWAIMMVGMMVPSAAPMILLYAAILRKGASARPPYRGVALFTAGYLACWAAFSLVAATVQWGLSELALVSPMMVSTSPLLTGALFVAAGLYQVTPWKHVCLRHCRSPARFISAHWRRGPLGPLRMGIAHGAFCLGCCWMLMALLFALGVMNLLWVGLLTLFVLAEKLLPSGPATSRAVAAVMVLGGLGLVLAG